ncbi:alkaline phosphatase D family protein [Frankia sp. CNm7]|uniref:Alkaline phosphatase D family protein n=1 Tax=Frankia nepalensis TaxID=1836974 RepID=A0A937RJX8_9ACTN|nr:alkaline phosphatase D family protein [Frankia nepalensis]MBL7501723.1 alkaline phosphatase D family protein [Frankia nepalensis]MBL7514249.1 alkaline phosphatase D family protein [Frankia nepalensis]MBL7524817.1 alkaline phosphatase D family protein [Frankia nepalensis]MBL7633648.1 alkaline phosphatase D family protein [Frankia nepalensis]
MSQLPGTPSVSRRNLLRGGVVLGALGATGTLPAVAAQASGGQGFGGQVFGDRPAFTSGVQSADVTSRGGLIWARADRAAEMVVEVSTRPDFKSVRRAGVRKLTAARDFTGVVELNGLPAGSEVYYRVRLNAADNPSRAGATLTGRLNTAPEKPSDVSFVWTGDVAGQGWGINPEFGGMKIFEAMRKVRPDFALSSGDNIYADGPLAETVALPDGSVWRNLVVPEKLKVAETLAEYRGNFRYNLLDENFKRLNSEVSWIYQWDDHETVNNWYPGEILNDARYTEKRVDVLAANARRAFLEYAPISTASPDGGGRIYRKISYGPTLDVFVLDMRSYKNPNNQAQRDPAGAAILGAEQSQWLIRELDRSKATWKVIAADLPIGLIVPDGADVEAVAQGDGGAPLGREVEIARVLSSIKKNKVRNTVWITADVHYTAAHHYSPDRAAFKDFDPFWEFVAGPANAGTFGPNTLESTFGPEAVFVKAPPAGQVNLSPKSGLQFFGRIAIDGSSRALTVELVDLAGTVVWSKRLPAAR